MQGQVHLKTIICCQCVTSGRGQAVWINIGFYDVYCTLILLHSEGFITGWYVMPLPLGSFTGPVLCCFGKGALNFWRVVLKSHYFLLLFVPFSEVTYKSLHNVWLKMLPLGAILTRCLQRNAVPCFPFWPKSPLSKITWNPFQTNVYFMIILMCKSCAFICVIHCSCGM